MSEVQVERNYAMWIDDYVKVKGKIKEACVFIGLAEDEEGFDFDYIFIPVEQDRNKTILNFGGSTNYKFVGKKIFENTRLNYRYSLGTYEFTVPDEATRFNYMMLSRLQSDSDYVLGHFSNFCKRSLPESSIINALWGDSINHHFSEMYRLYDSFSEEEKPQWLSRKQIDEYKYKIKKIIIEE